MAPSDVSVASAAAGSEAAGKKRRHKRERKRPRAVTLLAIWMIVAGVFSLGGAITLFGLDALVRVVALSSNTVEKVKVDHVYLLVNGVLLILGGIVDVTVGVGALRLKRWAWTLGVAVAAYDIVTRLWALLIDDFSWPAAIGATMAIVVIFYLQQDDVKKAFGR